MTNDTTLDHADRLDDHGDLPLRPVPTLERGAPDAAAADRSDPADGRDPARVPGLCGSLPQGVSVQRFTDGRVRYLARVRNTYVGQFRTIEDAARAVDEARSRPVMSTAERQTRKAFAELLRWPSLWQLRGLTRQEQIAKIQSVPQRVRMYALHFLPHEDDPIFAVAMLIDDDQPTFKTLGMLYGCSSSYMQHVCEGTIEWLRARDSLVDRHSLSDRGNAWEAA